MLNKYLICLMFFINLNFIVLRNNHISWRGHISHAEGQMLESRSRRTKSFKQLATFPMRWSLSRMYCAALDAASKSFVTAQLQHEGWLTGSPVMMLSPQKWKILERVDKQYKNIQYILYTYNNNYNVDTWHNTKTNNFF